MYAGWASFGRTDRHRDLGPDTELLLAKLTPFHTPDRVGTKHLDRFTAAQAITFNTPESQDEVLPSICPVTGNVLTSWLRLDNRTDLGRDLGFSGGELRRATDPDLVLAAYRRWGVGCASKLEGDFSFALWDQQRQALYLARDSIGVKPLFYTNCAGAVAFATTAAVFPEFPLVDTEPHPVWLARFISETSMSFTETPFPGVLKLAPGHWLLATDEGPPKIQRFHEFVDDAPWADERDPARVAEYRLVLEEAMLGRLRSSHPHGVETSGGLDSSTIVGFIPYLDESQLATLQTYGSAIYQDEPRRILETSRFHAIRRNNILTSLATDHHAGVIRGLRTLGYPVEHGSVLTHIPFYSMVQESRARTLHSGFGGDEVVTNHGRHLTQELMSRRRWRLALSELPGRPIARPARFLKRTTNYIRSGSLSATEKARLRQRLTHQLLNDEALEVASIRDQLMSRVSDASSKHTSINSWILGDCLASFVPTRTEQSTLVAASYGIDYRWALLDRRLMQQYLSTPAIEKWGEGFGRFLHRRAIAGVVPPAIAWSPSKNMGPISATRASADSGWVAPLEWADIHPTIQAILNPAQYRRHVSVVLQSPASVLSLWNVRASLEAVSTLNSWVSET